MLGHGAISEFAISEIPADEPPLGPRPVVADFLRGSADAYQAVLPRFAVQSEPQEGIGLVVPATAPGSRRAATDAYQAASRAVVADEPEPVNGLVLPQAAPGARRAAADAYQTAS